MNERPNNRLEFFKFALLSAQVFLSFFVLINGMEVHNEVKFIPNTRNIFITSLISGGLAGTCVDIALFPLDTLKTRLQSKNGFKPSGGFSHLYKGIGPVLLGSAPTAALFFMTYEGVKTIFESRVDKAYHPLVYMGSASCGEVISCLIRVPVEFLKQRKQVMLRDQGNSSLRMLYRGYLSTLLRDLPFSLIQFPIWEYFKRRYGEYLDRDIFPFEGAICGAMAGCIAAAATTPLDVVKTRIMLSNTYSRASEIKISSVLYSIYFERGLQGLFAGIGPRVLWIGLGGFIFFGVYETSSDLLSDIFPKS